MTGDASTRGRPPLARPRACLVAGVSVAVAEHLGLRLWLVRALFIAATLLNGAGLLLYLWLVAFTPRAAGSRAPHSRVPVVVLTLSFSAVMAFFALVVALAGSGGIMITLTLLACAAAVAANWWVSFVDRSDPARGTRTERLARITATLILMALVLTLAALANLLTVALAVVSLMALGLVFVPTILVQRRQLTTERARVIREEQRAQIAAHLHDSVLQTLALIQNRAGASSEVARLARAQERELRSWLYAGDSVADSDLGSDLRDFAAALELDYPVRMDVVVVGVSAEKSSGELAAAAREAMLNAAQHAGGQIAVYVEGTPTMVDVYVRDHGPGFDPESVPEDRLGVRESIMGRMRRIGGRATIAPAPGGGGTEVHIQFPVAARMAQ